MATEKRLVYKEDVLAMAWLADECEVVTALDIEGMPTVDAVPVDELKFLYCAIDKNGIPELKIQLGDRILCLRRENDPVDVVSVVRCKDCKHWCTVDCATNYGSCSKLEDRYKEDCESSFDETTRFDDFCSYGEKK